MKTIKLIPLFFIFLGFAQSTTAQSADIPAGVIQALKSGDAAKLSAYFNDNVQLVIGSRNEIYSKQQSYGIVADFFRKNPVNDFEVLHQSSKETASFLIGTLHTSGGKFRVSVLTRKNAASTMIQQLRIE